MWHKQLIILILATAVVFLVVFNIPWVYSHHEFNRAIGEELVLKYQKTGEVDSVLFDESNAVKFIPNHPYYLFIEESTKSDYNGSIYSLESAVPDSIHFNQYYLTYLERTARNWTVVYGKW
ncbi:MAG: hypothetical protein MK078_03840 [Crocinitomicaceae bacterium]|nr:hypothetical protein [Crocinitomicaceae bacterium]